VAESGLFTLVRDFSPSWALRTEDPHEQRKGKLTLLLMRGQCRSCCKAFLTRLNPPSPKSRLRVPPYFGTVVPALDVATIVAPRKLQWLCGIHSPTSTSSTINSPLPIRHRLSSRPEAKDYERAGHDPRLAAQRASMFLLCRLSAIAPIDDSLQLPLKLIIPYV
jgi:hypothetical protein